MWCAAGRLLKSEPLASHEEDNWNEQSAVIAPREANGAASMVLGPTGSDATGSP